MNTLYEVYVKSGFKALKCAGYNPSLNKESDPQKKYKRAKEPITEGYTDKAYKGLPLEECGQWEAAGGWIGWLIPQGVIALDIDKEGWKERFAMVKEICSEHGLKPAIHKTNNGVHVFFKTNANIPGNSQAITKAGIKLTYRAGGKNQLILAPTNSRSWEITLNGDLPEIPIELTPYDPKNKDDVLNILAVELGETIRAETLSGYEDIDTSFMVFLIEAGIEEERILQVFQRVFQSDFDERKTSSMCARAKSKLDNGDKLRGAGSFIFALREKGLNELSRLARIISGKPERRLKAISLEEFLSMEFPPRENVLSPWLPSQGLAMIHAYRGYGKTHLSLGIAYAVASAGTFLRWTAPNPSGVLLLDGEMPGKALQERYAAIVASNEKEPAAPCIIITPDLQEWGMPDLSDPEGQRLIEEHLPGISLVIVDNLSTLCRSGRENEGESWLPVQEWALRLRSRGISVLFIHHAGKGGQQRGTSRKEDVLDTVINLKRPADYRPDEGARFEVHFEKSRGIYGDDVKPFETQLTTTMDGRQTWTIKDLEDSLTERVADLLNDGIPQSEIGELLGISKGYVSKCKKKAAQEGLLNGGKS